MDTLAETVDLSRNACWRRVKALESAGIITGRVAIVDPSKIGLGLTVLMMVRTKHRDESDMDSFADALKDLPEVLSAHRVAGDLDYVMRVRVEDVRAYDGFYRRLIAKVSSCEISASFVVDDIKDTTELPI